MTNQLEQMTCADCEIAIRSLRAENQTLNDNLTATQTRCTELIQENRDYRVAIERLRGKLTRFRLALSDMSTD